MKVVEKVVVKIVEKVAVGLVMVVVVGGDDGEGDCGGG